MSSSWATAAGSRSPSPLTPEPSDSLEPVAIQSDLDLASSWYLSMHPTKSSLPPWESDPSLYLTPHKSEENQILCLDELIEQHAYDEYAYHHSPAVVIAESLSLTHPVLHLVLSLIHLLLIIRAQALIARILRRQCPPFEQGTCWFRRTTGQYP